MATVDIASPEPRMKIKMPHLPWTDAVTCGYFVCSVARIVVIIPAHNEEGCIEGTLRGLHALLVQENISHELVVVDDNSKDATPVLLASLGLEIPCLRVIQRAPPNGYGLAVRAGLDAAVGWAVVVCMADASDSPKDVAWRKSSTRTFHSAAFLARCWLLNRPR